jgi:hypothetical protein
MQELGVNKLDLEFKGNDLHVELEYERVQTLGEEAERKSFYQWRWESERGVRIPLDQISVRPKAGEVYPVMIYFRLAVGQPLYIGVWGVHQENPRALPKAMEWINYFKDNFVSDNQHRELLDWTLEGFDQIINPKGPLPPGIRGYLAEREVRANRTYWPMVEG